MRRNVPAFQIARIAKVAALVLALSFLTAGFPPSPARATQPAKPKLVETNPARDRTLRDYLQKHFKIPNAEWIKFGPAVETPIPGLYSRLMTVTVPPSPPRDRLARSVSTTLYVDKDQDTAIIGQLLDLTKDPWGRIDPARLHLNDRPVLGSPGAPVTVVEFADFECPYCAHAFSIVESLVNNTYKDKIKLIFKNYPLNQHKWALKAALAAECARLQNPAAFWSFARYFYTNQNQIKPENLHDKVDQLAQDLKLDDTALRACMESTQAAKRIKQDQADGTAVKVNSTPTFYIDGIPVVGLPEEQAFNFVVDSELKRLKAQAAR